MEVDGLLLGWSEVSDDVEKSKENSCIYIFYELTVYCIQKRISVTMEAGQSIRSKFIHMLRDTTFLRFTLFWNISCAL